MITDIPGRSFSSPATPAGTSMRTGTRCTILVKLPVALSGGSSKNTEPEAGATLTTLASCQSMTFKPLLFNATGRPSDARIEHVAATAVRTFLAAYRR
jgi:hypothetical protein